MKKQNFYFWKIIMLLFFLFQINFSIAQNLEVLASYPTIRLNNLTELLADENVTVADLQHESNITGITFSNDVSILKDVKLAVSQLDSIYGYETYDLGMYLNARVMKEKGEEIIQNVYDGLSANNDKFILNVFYVVKEQAMIEYTVRVKWGNGLAENNISESNRKDVLLDSEDAGNIYKSQNISINAHYNAQALIVSRFTSYLEGYLNNSFMSSIQSDDSDAGDELVPTILDVDRTFLSPAGFPIYLPENTKIFFFNGTKPKTPRGALIKFRLPVGKEYNGYRLFTGKIDQNGDFAGYGPPNITQTSLQLYYKNTETFNQGDQLRVRFGTKKYTNNGGCFVYNLVIRYITIDGEPNDLTSGPMDIKSDSIHFKEEAFTFSNMATPEWPSGLDNSPPPLFLTNLDKTTAINCYNVISEIDINKSRLVYVSNVLNGDTIRTAYFYTANNDWVYTRIHQYEPVNQYFRYQEGAWKEFIPEDISYFQDLENLITNLVFSASAGHLFLDIVGVIPFVGEVADFANGTWYYLEGNYVEAGLSYAGMVPFVGVAVVGGGKWAFKTAKGLNSIQEGVKRLAFIKGNEVVHAFKKADLNIITTKMENVFGIENISSGIATLFKNDIIANPDLVKLFKDKPGAIEAWNMFRQATNSNVSSLRKDLVALEKLADDMASNPQLKNFIKDPSKNLDASLATWKYCDDANIPFCNF